MIATTLLRAILGVGLLIDGMWMAFHGVSHGSTWVFLMLLFGVAAPWERFG